VGTAAPAASQSGTQVGPSPSGVATA